MTALELLTARHARGVTLTPWVDHLRVDAPQGVLTANLRQAMREHKAALRDLVMDFEARAALIEYDGGFPRGEAERLAWACVLGESQP